MAYTVKDISTKTGITAHTLRFYEKKGVLPYAERTENGVRIYDESSIEWIETILALRSTGISLEELKEYVELFKEGDSTLLQRKELLNNHKVKVEEQLQQLINTLGRINYKMALFDVQLEQLERSSCTL
ncbi:MerR family transcriptional regulator [Paenibacillus sp. PK3_47]|uniref:MerR family transcriptional regulator n=1 Tax=Paenibacillus sp. PK3_47 TaxID=2072642 RepID=UPI00201D78C7|nr:MerR family transcriptional regulator [Paenibacillus sp. PK3_47]UQZ32730.1 MerR family transcriptional regulator [Paenibacillus sp. PK3_47]